MNIFALSECPIQSARWHVDSHVVKMPLECAQMLANCFDTNMLESEDCPRTKKGTVRKHSYYNHPCSIWVRESLDNMVWTITYAQQLDMERLRRNPDKSPHFSMDFINWVYDNRFNSLVPEGDLTTFAIAMDDEYRQNDVIQSYRDYYKYGKSHLHKWKLQDAKPKWI